MRINGASRPTYPVPHARRNQQLAGRQAQALVRLPVARVRGPDLAAKDGVEVARRVPQRLVGRVLRVGLGRGGAGRGRCDDVHGVQRRLLGAPKVAVCLGAPHRECEQREQALQRRGQKRAMRTVAQRLQDALLLEVRDERQEQLAVQAVLVQAVRVAVGREDNIDA